MKTKSSPKTGPKSGCKFGPKSKPDVNPGSVHYTPEMQADFRVIAKVKKRVASETGLAFQARKDGVSWHNGYGNDQEYVNARDRIIKGVRPLVYWFVNRLCEHSTFRPPKFNGDMDSFYDDLVQAGTVALIRAIDKFDPDYGNTFQAFGGTCIEKAIWQHAGKYVRDHLTEVSLNEKIPAPDRGGDTGQNDWDLERIDMLEDDAPPLDEQIQDREISEKRIEALKDAMKSIKFTERQLAVLRDRILFDLKLIDDPDSPETSETNGLDEVSETGEKTKWTETPAAREMANRFGVSLQTLNVDRTKALQKLKDFMVGKYPHLCGDLIGQIKIITFHNRR